MRVGLFVGGVLLTASVALGVPTTTITAWRSVRTHSTVGTRAIVLDASQTPAGSPTVETRRGGIQLIEVDFTEPIGTVSAGSIFILGSSHNSSGSPLPPVSYTPTSAALVNSNKTLQINFAAGLMPDETCYTIDLSTAVSSLTGDTDCLVRALVADVNGSGGVTLVGDMDTIKSFNRVAVTAATAKYDVNTDGSINLTDAALAKTHEGHIVVCPAPPAINCIVSAWSSWSTCSAQCGGGTQTRTRTVVTPPANGGSSCPPLQETQACNTQPCAIDCVVSAWSSWGTCSAQCGGGVQTRTRTIITPAAFGGRPCPPLQETQACNTQPCAVDCVVSAWSSWGNCSAQCGGGVQARTRTITTFPAFGGKACPPLQETQSCNTQPCAIDCVVSAWSPWGTCSAQCGGGVQARTRTITTFPAFGGMACPPLQETQSCNTQPCTVDCLTQGVACAQDGGTVCNGAGQCVECLDDGYCAGGTVCQSQRCVPIACADGVQNGAETGTDCGGPCQPCQIGQGCIQDGDCSTQICRSNVCVAPSCNDGLKNGGETAVDCGAGCRTCPAGQSCSGNSDCAGNVCQSGVCNACSSDGQCPGGTFCASGSCVSVSCLDFVKNGTEVDVDCGGGSCARCAAGNACLVNGDCASSKCQSGVCAP